MAISVDPMTYVITVPQADLTPLGGSLYQLDVNQFRLWLKDWEDDENNAPFLKTHNHNTEVTLSGLTYARIVEVLAPYTIEFEDGNYTVSCTGANHNIADVLVYNQVNLIINNSAGLISNQDIEFAAYAEGVYYDVVNGGAGTVHPKGTQREPVDNWTDLLTIQAFRGVKSAQVIGDATLDTNDFTDVIFIGESEQKTEITVPSGATVDRAEFYNCTLAGTLDGDSVIRNGRIGTLSYINGEIQQCLLDAGTVTLGGSKEAIFLDCWSAGGGVTPVLNMGGSGQDLTMRNFSGTVKIENLSGASDTVSITLIGGDVILENTVTNGTIVVKGNGVLKDTSGNEITTGTWNTNVTIDTDELLSQQTITDKNWNAVLTGATYNVPASAGRRLRSIGNVIGDSVNDVAATVTSFKTNQTAVDDFYNDQLVRFTSGNLEGLVRIVLDYAQTDGLITVSEDMPEAPADGDDFDIVPIHVHPLEQIENTMWEAALTDHLTDDTFGSVVQKIWTKARAIFSDLP